MLNASDRNNVEERFRRAVTGHDTAVLRELLGNEQAARALINAPVFSFGGTALGQVTNDPDMVDVLLEFGADPNRRSQWWAGGFHPLHTATSEVAERLLTAGAVPDACAAAHLDRMDLLLRLLDEDPQRVHERAGDGQTPLHFARSTVVADVLLERGADIDAPDVDHRSTPAQWMLDKVRGAGRYHLAGHLVSCGAATDVFLAAALGLSERLREMLATDPTLLELRTGQGAYGEQPTSSYHIYFWTIGPNLSPMQVAEQFRQQEALDVMRSFADAKQRFLAACSAARAYEARRVLSEYPGLMGELTTSDHRTLADAASTDRSAAVELMMELGFDPAVPGPLGGSALHCAAWRGAAESVRSILRRASGRALVNERDAVFGGTPLGWCWHGSENCSEPDADHAVVAELLLRAGTIPDAGWREVPPWLRTIIDSSMNL